MPLLPLVRDTEEDELFRLGAKSRGSRHPASTSSMIAGADGVEIIMILFA